MQKPYVSSIPKHLKLEECNDLTQIMMLLHIKFHLLSFY